MKNDEKKREFLILEGRLQRNNNIIINTYIIYLFKIIQMRIGNTIIWDSKDTMQDSKYTVLDGTLSRPKEDITNIIDVKNIPKNWDVLEIPLLNKKVIVEKIAETKDWFYKVFLSLDSMKIGWYIIDENTSNVMIKKYEDKDCFVTDAYIDDGNKIFFLKDIEWNELWWFVEINEKEKLF